MWKDEYVKLAFPLRYEELQIEQAQALKYQHIPQYLYRYRNFTSYNIENFKNGIEWQSYPSEFNDPYDSLLTISLESFKKSMYDKNFNNMIESYKKANIEFSLQELQEVKSSINPRIALTEIILNRNPQLAKKPESINQMAILLDKSLEMEYEKIADTFRDSFNKGYLVVCFSEKKDDILMWSHYAENHTGYCIEYDFKSLDPSHPRIRLLEPVIYGENFFDATTYYINALSGNRDFNNLYGIYPTISKSTQWAHEKEWRTVFPWGPGISKDDLEKRRIFMPLPKRVLLGAKISEENKKLIMVIAKDKNIPVYQMILDRNGFKLIEESV